MSVTVTNTQTGETQTYLLPARDAVNNAFHKEQGIHDARTYGKTLRRVVLSECGQYWVRGDWMAPIEQVKP